MRVHSSNVGTGTWRDFQRVVSMGRGAEYGRLPRGGAQVGASPVYGESSKLPDEWAADAAYASHVVYHYGTAVAWIDSRDGGWVVPEVYYSPMTSGVQTRIRTAAGVYRTNPTA